MPSLEPEPTLRSKDFAVIAGCLHDPNDPVLGQAELFAKITVGTHGALELGLVGFGHFVDVLLGHAEFFGADHRKQRPFHDVEPLIVAMADHRPERLLRDHFGQHDVIGGIGDLQALGVELGDV